MPELVTQQAWTLLLEQPAFVERAGAFPLDTAWFTPAVPSGTAFDLRPGHSGLDVRGRRRGRSRREWAYDMPYAHWTLWSDAWLAVDGKPTLSTVRSAFGSLLSTTAVLSSRSSTWGPRAAATGLRPTDIIVGVDGWRVREHAAVRRRDTASLHGHDDADRVAEWTLRADTRARP